MPFLRRNKMNKNAIFYTIYANKEYEKLLLMSLQSLSKYKNFDIIIFSNFDIQIETDNRTTKKIINFPIGRATPMGYRFMIMNDLLSNYESVLHADCDTIFINDPNVIFDDLEVGKINIASETNELLKIGNDKIIGEYWAGPLLTKEEKETFKNIPSICCGVFAGKKESNILCQKIYKNVENYEKKGFFSICYDQHSICEYLIKNNAYSFNLQKYVCHNGSYVVRNNLINFMIENKYVILHYAGGVSPNKEKIMFMKKTLEVINE